VSRVDSTQPGSTARSPGRFPAHGWVGLALVAVFWPLNWFLPGARTHFCFFPLWLGYCLVVDGLNVRRSGTSLLTRSRRLYVALFFISAPLWWLFEAINLRTQNWHYLGRELFSDLEYALTASLSFSTVVPAVLGSAELLAGVPGIARLRGPVIGPSTRTRVVFVALGVTMLALLLAWPRLFFPFVWLSVYFLFDAVNLSLGHRSLVDWTRDGRWGPVVALWLGALLCGFFWEMWNYYAFPKWIYTVPGVGFWKVFEMPLLGYGGYLPFAMEVFAATYLVLGRSGYVAAGLDGKTEARG